MTGCLDDNEASEFASGSLGNDASMRVETHLATCRDCRSLVAALAPSLDDADGDSDVITSPRRVAMGKRGKRAVDAIAPTERPRGHGASTDPASPRARREDPVIVAGDEVGRYIILARLGAGGMGVVFTAYDPQLDRKVALKLLRNAAGLEEGEAHNRLIREAQAIAQLSHPNVVAVYDVGTADSGEVYIAMELVEGETLTSWLGHWDRSWREILELFFQAGRGLSAAHARGLMHRDFKPDNVLVGTDGRVRVTDFGLARSLIEQVDELVRDHPRPDLEALRVTLTATGTVLGTPRYMAPEQLRGVDADARSDQFSFCVALYEALYHRHPLPGDSVFEMVQHGAVADALPDSDVPTVIGKAILRGLSADPDKRFPALAALLVELTPPPVVQGRRGLVAALGGLALVAGGVAAAMVARGDASTSRDPQMQHEIDALLAERDQLREQLRIALYADGGLADKNKKIRTLEKRLEQAEAKIDQLVQKVTPDAGPAVVVRPHRPPPDAAPSPRLPAAISQAAFTAAIAERQGQIDSCMKEWIQRNPDESATLKVQLSVNPAGRVVNAPASGMDDAMTPNCVSRAISRAVFPVTEVVTTAEVIVSVAGGQTVVEATVTGSRVGQTIDLEGSPP